MVEITHPKASNCFFCGRPVIKEHGYIYLNARVTQIFPESKDGSSLAQDLFDQSIDCHRKCAMSEMWKLVWHK